MALKQLRVILREKITLGFRRPTKMFLTGFITGLLAVLNLLFILYVLLSEGSYKLF